MPKVFKYFFGILFLTGFIFLISGGKDFHMRSLLSRVSGAFSKVFEEKVAPEDLLDKYKKEKISVLVVPGHDNVTVGTQFGSVLETDLNVELTYELIDLLMKDRNFDVFTTREANGDYSPWFANYLNIKNESIRTFRDYVKKVASFFGDKAIVQKTAKVKHNPAADNTSLNLYAINKSANENNIDIVLHVHFNDYPGRGSGAGKYTGFAIYVPEKQLPNSSASIAVAQSIKKQLEKYYAKSSFPGERDVIIEDQELIAVGSNASRNGVSILMEYGYIYESQFVNSGTRTLTMKELAAQTYLGLKAFFEGKDWKFMKYNTALLSYEWKSALQKEMKGLGDIVHLQAALIQEGLYPPVGKTFSDCPMSGVYGNCTASAVRAFQERYGIGQTGNVGSQTLDKLNSLYSL
ncbi:MAG: N-acetylmuramoyl-L-alanine amidase [Patescibacteria group bacterium]